MSPGRFIGLLLLSAAVVFAAITGLVVAIDPYGLFGSNLAPDVTGRKYFVNAYEREIKPVAVRRYQPRSVIIGSSRAAVGLRPETLENYAGKAYNFGINGAYLAEIEQALHIAVQNGARTVVYGIDYFTFTKSDDAQTRKLLVFAQGSFWDRLGQVSLLSISLKALVDSAKTVWNNMHGVVPSHSGNGRYSIYDPSRLPIQPLTQLEGEPVEHAYAIFKRLLDFAKRRQVDLRLFISPVYGGHLRSDRAYTIWRERIDTISRAQGLLLYDFSADEGLTAKRQNFFDASHYRPEIGDRILSKLFKTASSKEPGTHAMRMFAPLSHPSMARFFYRSITCAV